MLAIDHVGSQPAPPVAKVDSRWCGSRFWMGVPLSEVAAGTLASGVCVCDEPLVLLSAAMERCSRPAVSGLRCGGFVHNDVTGPRDVSAEEHAAGLERSRTALRELPQACNGGAVELDASIRRSTEDQRAYAGNAHMGQRGLWNAVAVSRSLDSSSANRGLSLKPRARNSAGSPFQERSG